MTELSDLIRSGNRFQKMLDDGQKAKAIAREAGITPGAFWKAVYAARDDPAPIAVVLPFRRRPDATERVPLGADFVAMLHQVRDEIRAADRRAIEAEIKEERLRG